MPTDSAPASQQDSLFAPLFLSTLSWEHHACTDPGQTSEGDQESQGDFAQKACGRRTRSPDGEVQGRRPFEHLVKENLLRESQTGLLTSHRWPIALAFVRIRAGEIS